MGKRGTGQENWVCAEHRLVARAGDKRFVDAGEECGDNCVFFLLK